MLITNIFFIGNPAFANDELWNKSVQLYENNKNYFPHEIISNTNELDKNGKVISNLLIDIKPKPKQSIMKGVTKVIKDGKNITAEYREKTKKVKSKLLMLKDINILFDKDSQKNIITSYSKNKEFIEGKKCRIYNFSFKKEKDTFKGRAWLEEETGMPAKLDFTLEPLYFGVTNLQIIYFYHKVSDTEFFLDNIKVDVKGSFLLFQKFFNLSVDFKDYYKIK